MVATKMFFRSGRLLGLPVSRVKYNALDDFQKVFQTTSISVVWTSWKSSDEVFNQMVLIFHSFKGFSDLEDFWDDLPVSRLKYNALDDFQKVFQTTSRKSSRRLPFQSSGLPGSLLTKSPFHNRSEHFGFSDLEDFWDDLPVFNQMILIFHSFKGFSDLEDFSDDLPVGRLKYNARDDFQEVFQTTSISVVWTSWKSSDEVSLS
ncbi:hypothetical protein DY000_02024565 [Brassica cretica]|uniref:Uncharacterized protein n=1 Tax=Brassica cretica TaxID=69181 RepID=A0ABQ7EKV8_BRACR|nr:hypothetical protein DY000_02024565 [Brassica cretica]